MEGVYDLESILPPKSRVQPRIVGAYVELGAIDQPSPGVRNADGLREQATFAKSGKTGYNSGMEGSATHKNSARRPAWTRKASRTNV